MAELDGQPTAPASETPAPTAFDPEAFKSSLVTELTAQWESKMNERISGIQSSYQAQLNEKDEQLRQLQLASLSEVEQEQLLEQEAADYVEQMERELWLAKDASTKYPNAAAHIQKLFETGGDVAAYAEYLESVFRPAPAPEPEPAETVPDVDPNSPAPAQPTGATVLPDGRVMTRELADQLLKSFGDTPIAQLRG